MRTPANLLPFFLESLLSTWHSREMANGLHTFLTLKAHYGAAKWTEASASSLPFLPCELFCRAGHRTGSRCFSAATVEALFLPAVVPFVAGTRRFTPST